MKTYDGLKVDQLHKFICERFPNLYSYDSAPKIEEEILDILKLYTNSADIVTQEKFCEMMQNPKDATAQEVE